MAYTSNVIFLASAARGTGTHDSAAQNIGFAEEMTVFLDVTAVSGTSPTLNVTIQQRCPLGNWYNHATFAQQTAVGRVALGVTLFGQDVRVSCVVGGTTPSFTFSITAVAKTTM